MHQTGKLSGECNGFQASLSSRLKSVGPVILLLALAMPLYINAGTNREYRASISGISDKKLEGSLKKGSTIFTLSDRPPATTGQLLRRISDDKATMLTILASQGYYSAEIEDELDLKASPTRIRFTIDTGRQYRLRDISVEYEDMPQGSPAPEEIKLLLKPNDPAIADDVIRAEKRIIRHLKTQGFPFPEAKQREAYFSDDAARVDIRLIISPGQHARFGDITVTGLKSLKSSFIRRRIRWKRGRPYDISRIEDLEKDLIETGAFGSVRVTPEPPLEDELYLPLNIHATERKLRSVSIGAGYRSDIGARANLSWTHRNLFGGGERLEISGEVSQIEYGVQTTFSRLDFLRPRQTALLDLQVLKEFNDAYSSKNITASAMLLPKLSRKITLKLGLGLRHAITKQVDTTEYTLLSLLTGAIWDTRRDIMDPVDATRFSLDITPSIDQTSSLSFTRVQTEARIYKSVPKNEFIVIALRGMLGSMQGTERSEVPADIRFFSGGAGSVRGYEYQTIGDVVDGTPLGGAFTAEGSIELRVRTSETIGLAAFVDAGLIAENELPTSYDSTQWGAGLGIRYFSPIGPVRIDGAVPLNPRDDIDDPFHFYISVGQAF